LRDEGDEAEEEEAGEAEREAEGVVENVSFLGEEGGEGWRGGEWGEVEKRCWRW
jgi:hypothetical protein